MLNKLFKDCSICTDNNKDVLKCMHSEAKSLWVLVTGCFGGLIIDETAIQQDLKIVKNGSDMCPIGNVEIGNLGNLVDKITLWQGKSQLAKSVLHFVFLGHTGFRFLVAPLPAINAQAHHIFLKFWEGVEKLEEYGFQVNNCSLDGAMANKQFL